jgi:hypothetical protein
MAFATPETAFFTALTLISDSSTMMLSTTSSMTPQRHQISDVDRDCEQCDAVNQPMPFIWCRYQSSGAGTSHLVQVPVSCSGLNQEHHRGRPDLFSPSSHQKDFPNLLCVATTLIGGVVTHNDD